MFKPTRILTAILAGLSAATTAGAQELELRQPELNADLAVTVSADESATPQDAADGTGAGMVEPAMYCDDYGDACYDDACGCGSECGCGSMVGGCCPPTVYWASAEVLGWWTKGMDTPELATTGSTTGLGVLGDPDTVTLFGGEDLVDDMAVGGRFRLGRWLTPEQRGGVEISYLLVDPSSDSFSASGADYAVLARPFFDVDAGAEDSRVIALPGTASGDLNIDVDTDFEVLDATFINALSRSGRHRFDFLCGYRFMELADSVSIADSSTALSGATAGTTVDVYDDFDTRNRFHGALMGLRLQNTVTDRWTCDAMVNVSLGRVQQKASIRGETVTDDGATTTTTSGGLLTQSTNLGDYEDDNFGAVYEVGVTLRRQIGCHCAFTVGYTYLAWHDVYRAGDQIDTELNPTQVGGGTLVGQAAPIFPRTGSDFWAQGLRFGLEGTY